MTTIAIALAVLIALPLALAALRAHRSPSLEEKHIEMSARKLADETGMSVGRCYDIVYDQHTK